MGRRRRIQWALWALVGVALVVVALRAFVADVYPIASSSMEPTLFPDEQVLVRFDRSVPRRGELLVVKGADGSPLVKRAMGLPGEAVLVTADGDLLTGADIAHLARRGLDGPGAPLVTVFDDRRQTIDACFAHGSSQVDPWTEVDGAWELDARELEPGGYAGFLRHTRGIHDDRLLRDGELHLGQHSVGDACVVCEVRPLGAGGELVLELVERGDRFRVHLDLADLADVPVTLERVVAPNASSGHASGELAAARVALSDDAWTTLRFLNVDDHLRLEVDGRPLLDHRYDGNTPAPGPIDVSTGERVLLGGSGCHVRFRAIRVLRDVHYTQRGTHGVTAPLTLGPREVFLLGDNSAESLDSREFGPVSLDRVIGRVTRVVWPLDRARSLDGMR